MDDQPAQLAPKDTQSTFIITSQQFFLLALVLLIIIGLSVGLFFSIAIKLKREINSKLLGRLSS